MARHRQRRHQQQEAGALVNLARRRSLLLGGAATLLGGATAANGQSAADYAVFTELSPDTKPMKPGWNRRVFTDTDIRKGTAIQCDFATGVVSLAPGIYHLAGMSIVTYHTGAEPPGTTTIKAPNAAAGYCRLRTVEPGDKADSSLRGIDNSDASVICIGSTSTANMVPSVFDTFFETAAAAQLVLEHQSGDKPDQIYLRVFTENSKWHALARLSIRRI
jgi:hypothetical protein